MSNQNSAFGDMTVTLAKVVLIQACSRAAFFLLLCVALRLGSRELGSKQADATSNQPGGIWKSKIVILSPCRGFGRILDGNAPLLRFLLRLKEGCCGLGLDLCDFLVCCGGGGHCRNFMLGVACSDPPFLNQVFLKRG